MKRKTHAVRIVLLWATLVGGEVTSAQHYTGGVQSINGGGGTSGRGPYSLHATLGQPAAASPATNGVYALVAGLWAVQTDEAPRMQIMRDTLQPGLVRISWPSAPAGFTLQQCTNLSTRNWTPLTNTVADDGASKFVTVPSSTGIRYYRLFKP
jgi:hypothetical protein